MGRGSSGRSPFLALCQSSPASHWEVFALELLSLDMGASHPRWFKPLQETSLFLECSQTPRHTPLSKSVCGHRATLVLCSATWNHVILWLGVLFPSNLICVVVPSRNCTLVLCGGPAVPHYNIHHHHHPNREVCVCSLLSETLCLFLGTRGCASQRTPGTWSVFSPFSTRVFFHLRPTALGC